VHGRALLVGSMGPGPLPPPEIRPYGSQVPVTKKHRKMILLGSTLTFRRCDCVLYVYLIILVAVHVLLTKMSP